MFYRALLLPDLRLSLAENNELELREFCYALHPAIIAEVLDELDAAEIWTVLKTADARHQADIFGNLSPLLQVAIVDFADKKDLTKLLEEMRADERVDFLGRLDDEHVEAILPLMAQAERADIRKLLSYPEGSAGSIMTTEYASLHEDLTVAEAFEQLGKQAPDSETIYYIYIVDEARKLDGVVTLRMLILAKRTAKLADIMRRDVICVRVDDEQEFVATEMARYDFLAIPVVDNQSRLVGIVTHDDAMDVLQEEAEEDAQLQGAVQPLDDDYIDTPLVVMAQKRGVWLILLLCAAFGNAALLKQFKDTEESFHWIGWFVPLVLACGGNAGSQSATLIIREIHTRVLSRGDKITLVLREMRVAMLLGLCMMTVAFVGAATLVSFADAGIVSATVGLMVLIGTLAGTSLPIAFKSLGMDPAVMSNPLIASLSDFVGVLVFFNAVKFLASR